jgi:hypothetical protein
MAIDRIGKGGGVPEAAAPKDPDATKRAEAPTRSFEAQPAAHVEQVEKVATTPLERLRAGEINVEQYLDKKVEEATAHLRGVGDAELEGIRSALRQRLATDPALAALVRRATGAAIAPPKDE